MFKNKTRIEENKKFDNFMKHNLMESRKKKQIMQLQETLDLQRCTKE